jgi:hypothetical protein
VALNSKRKVKYVSNKMAPLTFVMKHEMPSTTDILYAGLVEADQGRGPREAQNRYHWTFYVGIYKKFRLGTENLKCTSYV